MGAAPTVWTGVAVVILVAMIYAMFRKPKFDKVEAKRAVPENN